MMTLEEMKLAVCEKLPKLILWRQGDKMATPYHREGFFWRGMYDSNNLFREVNWPTEGLQVCHEAEKRLSLDERAQYINWLSRICEKLHRMASVGGWLIPTATYEQRLEALCRVWFPERF